MNARLRLRLGAHHVNRLRSEESCTSEGSSLPLFPSVRFFFSGLEGEPASDEAPRNGERTLHHEDGLESRGRRPRSGNHSTTQWRPRPRAARYVSARRRRFLFPSGSGCRPDRVSRSTRKTSVDDRGPSDKGIKNSAPFAQRLEPYLLTCFAQTEDGVSRIPKSLHLPDGRRQIGRRDS